VLKYIAFPDRATVHGLGNVVVLVLFAAIWLIRRGLPEAPTTTALVLSFAGMAIAAMTGCWEASWSAGSASAWTTAPT
jgi:hypothetical protein